MSDNKFDPVAEAIFELSHNIKMLGNGTATISMASSGSDAAPGIGAIENHAMAIKESSETIAGALDGVADAIRQLANSIEESK